MKIERAPLPDGLQPEMRTLQLDALRGTLVDLQSELGEFDALHDATLIEATGIAQLPVALIRARIASGLTQRELAERVGVHEQAIQRYEASNFAGASFSASSQSRPASASRPSARAIWADTRSLSAEASWNESMSFLASVRSPASSSCPRSVG